MPKIDKYFSGWPQRGENYSISNILTLRDKNVIKIKLIINLMINVFKLIVVLTNYFFNLIIIDLGNDK